MAIAMYSTFSEPAKSTRYNFPDNFFWFSKFSCLTLMRKTEWDLDECSFISENKTVFSIRTLIHSYQKIIVQYILVTAICLFDLPSSITSNTSSGLDTNLSVAPLTNGTLFLSSWTLRFTLDTATINSLLLLQRNKL